MVSIIDCIDKDSLFQDYPELADRNFDSQGYLTYQSLEKLVSYQEDERIAEYLYCKLGWKKYRFFIEEIVLMMVSSYNNHFLAIGLIYQMDERFPIQALNEQKNTLIKINQYYSFAVMLIRYSNGNKILDAWLEIDTILENKYGIKQLIF